MRLDVAIDEIQVPPGRRALRDVTALAESIREVGLLNPIVITTESVLVAGLHRLEACRLLGHTTIACTALQLSEVDAQLAEIDENLFRHELTVLERGEVTARRKDLYEAKHPETRKDVIGGHAKAAASAGEPISLAPSFAADTATKLGVSERSVQHDVQIATNIVDDVKEAIRATPLADNKTELLALARMPAEQQREAVKAVASGAASSVRKMSKAAAVESSDEDVEDEDFEREVVVGDEPQVGVDIADDNRWGAFETTKAVAEIVLLSRDALKGLQDAFSRADPRCRDELRHRAQDAVLSLMLGLEELLPQTARDAERKRAGFGVIRGGRS